MSKHALFVHFQARPAAALSVALILTACAAPEVAPPTQSELHQMAKAVLKEAVYTHTILKECASVGPELKAYTEDLAMLWENVHGEALAGADTQYSASFESSPSQIVEYEGKRLALDAVRFDHKQQARAREELRLDGRSLNNRSLFCERRLEALEENLEQRPYLNSESERERQTLEALAGRSSGAKTMTDVPALSGFIEPNQAPGRSYHQLEEQAKSDCADSELVVIDNDWPREAYAHYCRGEAVALIACEWGECREE